MVLAKPLVKAVSMAWSLVPRGRLPLLGRIVVEALAQDHSASASILQGLVYGRTAPPSRVRRTIQAPTLIIGHPGDPLHPFSDANALLGELPRATLLEAESLLELRTRPNRLTPRIADWLDDAWRGDKATPARTRGKSARGQAKPPARRPISRAAGGVTRRAGSAS
jgi:hypothetical protein